MKKYLFGFGVFACGAVFTMHLSGLIETNPDFQGSWTGAVSCICLAVLFLSRITPTGEPK